MQSLSIVIPVYNEAPNLQPLHAEVTSVARALGCSYEIVLVNDGSTDDSAAVLDAIAACDGAVRVIHLRRNFGQTAALAAGLHLASGDLIVTLDADLQNDPADIPLLLAKLDEGHDLAHGWRRRRHDDLLRRAIPSRVANWLISRATGFAAHDLGCTLKAMRREIADELQLYGDMHRFIPILAHWRGANCVEVETNHRPRRFGVSKYGLSRTLRVLLDLITVKYMIEYQSCPMRLFGGLGLAGLAVGGLAAATAVVMKLVAGIDITSNPLLWLSFFGALAGMQFFLLGMLGEVSTRTYYECQGKRPYAIRSTRNFDRPVARPRPANCKAA